MISPSGLSKMTNKSKNLKWEANKAYHPTQESSIVYAEKIALYGDKIFLIHESMIFKGGSVADSAYSVYSFDENGEYLGPVKLQELPDDFFYKIDLVEKI